MILRKIFPEHKHAKSLKHKRRMSDIPTFNRWRIVKTIVVTSLTEINTNKALIY